MSGIRIEIESAVVKSALEALSHAMGDIRKPLDELGNDLLKSHRDRFATKRAPDGSMWADNSPLTILRKKRNDPLIGESKNLQRQFSYSIGSTSIEFGSTVEYAAVQHFGAKQGAFGRTKKNNPIPFGDIPARPFLGLSDQDELNVLDLMQSFFEKALKRK